MANDDEKWKQQSRDMTLLVGSIDGLVDICGQSHALLCDLTEWLKEPPANDLPDLLRSLSAQMSQISTKLDELPAKIARAITTDEAP